MEKKVRKQKNQIDGPLTTFNIGNFLNIEILSVLHLIVRNVDSHPYLISNSYLGMLLFRITVQRSLRIFDSF